MAIAVPLRRKLVTATFLTKPGGYLTDGLFLYFVLQVPHPNDKTILVENCSLPPGRGAIELQRGDAMKMEIVRWPDGMF